jgi:hypothetical protein
MQNLITGEKDCRDSSDKQTDRRDVDAPEKKSGAEQSRQRRKKEERQRFHEAKEDKRHDSMRTFNATKTALSCLRPQYTLRARELQPHSPITRKPRLHSRVLAAFPSTTYVVLNGILFLSLILFNAPSI